MLELFMRQVNQN